MPFWSKPNIEKMILQRDVKGLNIILNNSRDYMTTKSAILGLISLNELVTDLLKLLYLANDTDPEIRKIVYSYMPSSRFGLFTSITALHDQNSVYRAFGLECLRDYHLPLALSLIKRSSYFDPDEGVKNLARNFHKEYLSDHTESDDMQIPLLYACDYGWLSKITLMEEFIYVTERSYETALANPPQSTANSLTRLGHYDSPMVKGFRAIYRQALSLFPIEEKKALNILLYVHNNATQAYNSFAAKELGEANEEIRRWNKEARFVFGDYIYSSIIMLSKSNAVFKN